MKRRELVKKSRRRQYGIMLDDVVRSADDSLQARMSPLQHTLVLR